MPLSSALIVEPREHPSSFSAIENVRKNIGNDIPIIWFHGTSNKEFAENIASKIENIRLREIPVDNLPSAGHYSAFMLNPGLWKEMRHYAKRNPNSKTLVFQTDSGFCNMDTDRVVEHLEKIEDVDYIGAPAGIGVHQNGGFSYRDVDGMLKISTQSENIEIDSDLWDSGFWLQNWQVPDRRPPAEDKLVTATCRNMDNCTVADEIRASEFSCCAGGRTAVKSWPEPLAFHGNIKHFVGNSQTKPFQTVEDFFQTCPGAKDILDP